MIIDREMAQKVLNSLFESKNKAAYERLDDCNTPEEIYEVFQPIVYDLFQEDLTYEDLALLSIELEKIYNEKIEKEYDQ